jgi:predicted RecA/RadA family phage recombinase
MKNFVEDGCHLTWINGTAGNVASDSVVVIGSLLGVTSVDIATADVVINGTFAADASWTKGGTWTIAAGGATRTAGAAGPELSQAWASMISGVAYVLTFTMTRTAGTLTVSLGGGTGVAHAAAGTFTDVLVAAATNTNIVFSADATFAGTVDNVTLRPHLVDSAVAGTVGTVNITPGGTYSVPKVAGTAWTAGAKLAWDASAAAFDVQASYSSGAGDIQNNAIAVSGASAATTGNAKLNCDVGTVV